MKRKIISKLMLFISFALVMLISLLFSNSLEILFKLKPDLSKINAEALEVHFVDVGNGDAILVKSGNTNIIIDSGEQTHEKRLLNYVNNVFFRDVKNKEFDYAILTHSDSDHSGNMLAILNNYKVKTFIRPKIYAAGLESAEEPALYVETKTYADLITKLFNLQVKNETRIIYAEMNICVINKDLNLNILAPVKNYYNSTNEYSTVITLEKFGKKFMLTGDATINNELEIINNNNAELLNVDVLKLGHHGSKTSTSLNFLEATSPSLAIISVGQNGEGNPSPDVLNNILTYNLGSNTITRVMQTSELGNIICYVNPNCGVETICINSVSDYLFVGWWVVVVLVLVITTILVILPILVKWLKLGKTSKL